MPATISRTGVQVYPGAGPNGTTLREYRPADEVFSADSLASLASVPITWGHPADGVDPGNYRKHQIGHVTDASPEARVRLDGSDAEWVRTALVIGDGQRQEQIDNADAELEVSCGYSCELEMTPGVAPNGEHYDGIQRRITFNHVAILPRGEKARAGAEARLRLDNKENCMKIIVIDGAEYELGSEKHLARLDSDHKAALSAANSRADKAEAARDTAAERADKAEAALKSDALDSRVQARFDLLKRAAQFLPAKYETSGKSDHQVRCDALAAAGKDVAGKSEEYVSARFDGMTDSDKPATYVDGTKSAPRADASKADSDDSFRAELAKKGDK